MHLDLSVKRHFAVTLQADLEMISCNLIVTVTAFILRAFLLRKVFFALTISIFVTITFHDIRCKTYDLVVGIPSATLTTGLFLIYRRGFLDLTKFNLI